MHRNVYQTSYSKSTLKNLSQQSALSDPFCLHHKKSNFITKCQSRPDFLPANDTFIWQKIQQNLLTLNQVKTVVSLWPSFTFNYESRLKAQISVPSFTEQPTH